MLIPTTGTDMRDVNYPEIWKSVKQWSKDATEKDLLNRLICSSDMFATKEKPIYDCKFMLSGDAEEYLGTLVWKKSRVIYFSAEYHDLYDVAQQSDWKCFCGDDSTLTPELIAEKLKEK